MNCVNLPKSLANFKLFSYLCILKSNLIIYCNNREVIINHETTTSIKQAYSTQERDA